MPSVAAPRFLRQEAALVGLVQLVGVRLTTTEVIPFITITRWKWNLIMSMDISEGPSVPRVLGHYEPCYQDFLLHTKNYVVQYNQLYLTRLTLMREHMM